jgi:uncharacterized protein YjiS (DUF1127 family)
MKGDTMFSHLLPRTGLRRLSLIAVFRAMAARMALRRTRHRLALLDDHLLRDIGISREAAQAEAARKGWDAPDHWHR